MSCSLRRRSAKKEFASSGSDCLCWKLAVGLLVWLFDTMAGERKKPTAAEKGKAIMVEEKKRDKAFEAAVNAAHAAERRRPRELVIHEPPATAAESPAGLRRSERNRTASTGMDARGTPGSRKRARDDVVVPPTAPPPPPIVDGDDYRGLLSKALSSVVTVASDMSVGSSTATAYRTGLILVDEENYTLVLTIDKHHAHGLDDKIIVYFGGEKYQTEAYLLSRIVENDLAILIVQTDKRHEVVKFSCDPLSYEVIFTVCATSGTKLNDKANAPLVKELNGSLGIYKGTVGTPCCDALDACYEHIVGSEKYFQFGLSLHDDIITSKNIDAERHTAEIAVSAPVFRLNGEAAGLLFSEGGWTDSKIGLLAKSIILCMKKIFGSEWEENLKDEAEDWLIRRQKKLQELTV